MLGGDGGDTLVWNNGDGSDRMEGGEDTDNVVVNGAPAGDNFNVTANGARVKFERTNLGLFTLDIGDVEALNLNTGAGGDRVNVGDLTGTGMAVMAIDLGAGDGSQDIVTVQGKNTVDEIGIDLAGALVTIDGASVRMTVANSSAAIMKIYLKAK